MPYASFHQFFPRRGFFIVCQRTHLGVTSIKLSDQCIPPIPTIALCKVCTDESGKKPYTSYVMVFKLKAYSRKLVDYLRVQDLDKRQ